MVSSACCKQVLAEIKEVCETAHKFGDDSAADVGFQILEILEWFDNHRTLRISKEAHAAIMRFAGQLQIETGKEISISKAIEEMAHRCEE